MQISEQGQRLIQDFEACRLEAYPCSARVWTIGYGHTGSVKPGDQITVAQAEAWLAEDIAAAEKAVNTLVTVPLSQGQFDALCSFVFNVGRPAFASSTLLKKLNAGEVAGAADEFLRWVHAGPKALKGLKRRRTEERALFLQSA
ncbi:gp53 [Sodalis phage phiSG1]|uniref:endolysin n=1 Tax=Sodalis phage phiSG1 TaxID=373126 RepID=UPI00006C5BEF|nr:endolysin [Sodalis phage phiSG1]ABN42257.1 gp53 [Sodalis phage phiSG1]BAE80469.1 conserved hypothetical protein [Sodalis phage phiSG1]